MQSQRSTPALFSNNHSASSDQDIPHPQHAPRKALRSRAPCPPSLPPTHPDRDAGGLPQPLLTSWQRARCRNSSMVRAGRAPQPRTAPPRTATRPAAPRRAAMRSRRRHAPRHAYPATPPEATPPRPRPPRVVTSGRATIWAGGGGGWFTSTG